MRVEKSSPTVFTPLDNGTSVLLNVDTLFYYNLNRTGTAIWQQIEANQHLTVDDLVRATCDLFDVDSDTAHREVCSFVEKLEQLKVVRVV